MAEEEPELDPEALGKKKKKKKDKKEKKDTFDDAGDFGGDYGAGDAPAGGFGDGGFDTGGFGSAAAGGFDNADAGAFDSAGAGAFEATAAGFDSGAGLGEAGFGGLDAGANNFGSSIAAGGMDSVSGVDVGGGFAAPAAGPVGGMGDLDRGLGDRGFGAGASTRVEIGDVADLGENPTFEAIIAQEREIRKQFEQESDQFSQVVRTERANEQQLEQEVHSLAQQVRELQERERSLRSDVDTAKAQLEAARDAHLSTDLDDLTASVDRGQVAEELEFLAQKANDVNYTLDFMQNANSQLERHNDDLRQQVVRLEQERKIIGVEVTQENEAAKVEARQIAELRNMVDKLQRRQAAQSAQQQADLDRQQELNKIKMLSPSEPQGHSWARHVSTPGTPAHSAGQRTPTYTSPVASGQGYPSPVVSGQGSSPGGFRSGPSSHAASPVASAQGVGAPGPPGMYGLGGLGASSPGSGSPASPQQRPVLHGLRSSGVVF